MTIIIIIISTKYCKYLLQNKIILNYLYYFFFLYFKSENGNTSRLIINIVIEKRYILVFSPTHFTKKSSAPEKIYV